MAHCPTHEDQRPSLHVSDEHGKVLLKCFGGCLQDAVISALRDRGLWPDTIGEGVSAAPKPLVHSSTPTSGCTLTQYAAAKKLPVDFLEKLGLADMSYMSRPAVRFPYIDVDSSTIRSVRFRTELYKSEENDNRFRWRSGDKVCLYGLWRLSIAREASYIVIVEGESDCHTLWLHDIPAIGIPGASIWRETWDDYLNDIPAIYVVIEPDDGGTAVKNWIVKATFRDKVKLLEMGEAKDPSAMYINDADNFVSNFETVLASAGSWAEERTAEQTKQAAENWELARDLLSDPNLLQRIKQTIKEGGYAGDANPALLVYVTATSRLLERPQNIVIVAPSAAGKNRCVDAALELIPDEAYYEEKAGSERALIYTKEVFEHRIVVISEVDSIPEDGPAASAIRSIAEDNYMIYDVTERDDRSGRHTTRRIVKPGPTGLITTSTKSLMGQMGTRTLELTISDDSNQTREVLRAHAHSVQGSAPQNRSIEPFIALQRWLLYGGNKRVVVPFAKVLADLVPSRAVRMRRDFRQLLTCIQAIALLYQCQRETTPDGCIKATIEDYAYARELLIPVFDSIVAEGIKNGD